MGMEGGPQIPNPKEELQRKMAELKEKMKNAVKQQQEELSELFVKGSDAEAEKDKLATEIARFEQELQEYKELEEQALASGIPAEEIPSNEEAMESLKHLYIEADNLNRLHTRLAEKAKDIAGNPEVMNRIHEEALAENESRMESSQEVGVENSPESVGAEKSGETAQAETGNELTPEEIQQITGQIKESVRLAPMMQGGQETARRKIEEFASVIPKEDIESAIAGGLEGMTTYENRSTEENIRDVKETQEMLGLSNEDTARLLNSGLEQLTGAIQKIQEQRTVELADQKTTEGRKQRIKEEMESANRFIEQQRKRTEEVISAMKS